MNNELGLIGIQDRLKDMLLFFKHAIGIFLNCKRNMYKYTLPEYSLLQRRPDKNIQHSVFKKIFYI